MRVRLFLLLPIVASMLAIAAPADAAPAAPGDASFPVEVGVSLSTGECVPAASSAVQIVVSPGEDVKFCWMPVLSNYTLCGGDPMVGPFTETPLGSDVFVSPPYTPSPVYSVVTLYFESNTGLVGGQGSSRAAPAGDPCGTMSASIYITVAQVGVDKTASTDGVCPGVDPLIAPTGSTVTYCYEVTNLSAEPMTIVELSDDTLPGITAALLNVNPIPVGGEAVATVAADIFSDTTNTATVCGWNNLDTLVDIGAADIPSCSANVKSSFIGFLDAFEATDTATVTVVDPAPGLTVTKTVGMTEGVCATDAALTVEAGATVYYCYTATNTGNVTLATHTVVDDKLGAIATNLAYDLLPGESVSLFKETTLTESVTNVATWTATGELADPPVEVTDAATQTATANATAFVTVTQAPTPTPTPTATPAPPTPTPTPTGEVQPLAFTGSTTAPLIVIAAALLIAGYLALRTSRRGEQT